MKYKIIQCPHNFNIFFRQHCQNDYQLIFFFSGYFSSFSLLLIIGPKGRNLACLLTILNIE